MGHENGMKLAIYIIFLAILLFTCCNQIDNHYSATLNSPENLSAKTFREMRIFVNESVSVSDIQDSAGEINESLDI